MTSDNNIEEQVNEVFAEELTPEGNPLPRLPLLVVGRREGEYRRIGEVVLQNDGTMKGVVYEGAETALPALFSMPLAFVVDMSLRFDQDSEEKASAPEQGS